MKKTMMTLLSTLLFLVFSSFYVQAFEPLNIDRHLPSDLQLAFPNPNKIQPQRSDFEVINTLPLSSDNGERWALMTIQNVTNGNRTLTQHQLLAILANGSRIFPAEFTQAFQPKETLSLSIYFTTSDFPILQVISNSN